MQDTLFAWKKTIGGSQQVFPGTTAEIYWDDAEFNATSFIGLPGGGTYTSWELGFLVNII